MCILSWLKIWWLIPCTLILCQLQDSYLALRYIIPFSFSTTCHSGFRILPFVAFYTPLSYVLPVCYVRNGIHMMNTILIPQKLSLDENWSVVPMYNNVVLLYRIGWSGFVLRAWCYVQVCKWYLKKALVHSTFRNAVNEVWGEFIYSHRYCVTVWDWQTWITLEIYHSMHKRYRTGWNS